MQKPWGDQGFPSSIRLIPEGVYTSSFAVFSVDGEEGSTQEYREVLLCKRVLLPRLGFFVCARIISRNSPSQTQGTLRPSAGPTRVRRLRLIVDVGLGRVLSLLSRVFFFRKFSYCFPDTLPARYLSALLLHDETFSSCCKKSEVLL